MELARGAEDQIAELASPTSPGTGGQPLTRWREADRIDAETSTTLLRRCTALATRARVDLLTPGRRSAAEELSTLLGQMESWDAARLDPPDATMTVLAAAALQDLAERLPQEEPHELSHRIAAVLDVLGRVMAMPTVDVLTGTS